MRDLPSDETLALHRTAARDAVLRDLPTGRSRRAALVTVSGVGVAVLLTAGAIAVQRATQEEVSFSIECYAQASKSGEMTTVAVPESVSSDGVVSHEEADPVELCGAMWRMGLLGQEERPEGDPNLADFPVPSLVACRLGNGVGAAFPAEGAAASLTPQDFCGALNLAAW